jgi:hypothetical protein
MLMRGESSIISYEKNGSKGISASKERIKENKKAISVKVERREGLACKKR